MIDADHPDENLFFHIAEAAEINLGIILGPIVAAVVIVGVVVGVGVGVAICKKRS